MKSRFEPDVGPGANPVPAAILIDPEAYDASEQCFAASVEEKLRLPHFVADAVQAPPNDTGGNSSQPEGLQPATIDSGTQEPLEAIAHSTPLQTELLRPPDSGSWRSEVADRVNNYRTRRRPRPPRYPSLQLKFDPPPLSTTDHAAASQPAATPPSRLAVAMQDTLSVAREAQSIAPRAGDLPDRSSLTEAGPRILEFPRYAATPRSALDELAEPVLDRPRILEVPELLLPPPALGGILMEPVDEPAKDRRPGFELPLQAAPMSRRLWAGAIDSLLVVTAFEVFAYIYFRITSIMPPLRQAAGISVILTAMFWSAYQYVLLVYTGTTPGLKLAHLQLSRFDGTPVPKRIRRWRVLASVLSGLSLVLGYAWCFLDEDQLCWHDRITRTYMAPQAQNEGLTSSAHSVLPVR
jgi:uncharacterized RDD family membrane protein YckC